MLSRRRIQLAAARARRLVAGYAKELIRIDARDPARQRALARQVDAATHSLRSLCWPAIVVTPLMGIAFKGEFIASMFVIGAALICGTGCVVLRFARDLGGAEPDRVRRFARLHVIVAAALATGWSSLVMSIAIDAKGALELLMACVLVALICIGGLLYIALPAAFLAFSGILTLSLLAEMTTNPDLNWIAAPLTLLFFGIVARTVVAQAKQFVQLAVTGEALAATEHERHARAIAEAEQRAREERIAAEERMRASDTRHNEMIALADSFERSVVAVADGVAAAVVNLERAATELRSIADGAVSFATDASARAEGTSEAIATVAAATSQLQRAVSDITSQVAEHVEHSDKAQSLAADGEATIGRLSEEAARIGNIIALIENVTTQTNLLALNATIEASRAGEAGRGFAVVASEVKSLANQARTATHEVAEQVSGIHGQVQDAVAKIRTASDEIDGVAQIAATIAASIVQQRDAVTEIGRGAATAAETAEDVRVRMANLSTAARESESLTRSVGDAAAELGRQSETLRSATAAFLAKLRAA